MSKKKNQKLRSFFKLRIEEANAALVPERRADIENKARKLFETRWAGSGKAGSKSPDLLSLKITVEPLFQTQQNQPAVWYLLASASFWVNYHNKFCRKTVKAQHLWVAGTDIAQDEFEEQLAALLDRLEEDVFESINVLPSAYLNTMQNQFSSVKDCVNEKVLQTDSKTSFGSIVKKINGRISETESKLLPFVKEQAGKRIQALAPLPPGAVTADSLKCTLAISSSGNFLVNIRVTACADYPVFSRQFEAAASCSTLNLFEAFYYNSDQAQAEIEKAVQDAAEKIIPELVNNLSLCRLPMESLPKALIDAMNEEGVWYGKIHAVCPDCIRLENTESYDYIGDNMVRFTANSYRKSESLEISLRDIQEAEAKSIKLESKKSVPQNIAAFGKFCKAAGYLYETFSDKRIETMPELEFIFQDGIISRCEFAGESISLTDLFDGEAAYETTVHARLLELFRKVADAMAVWQERYAEQLAVLEELNPSEFAALRLIVESKECWYTEINNRLENSVLTTKVSMGPYLDHLCRMTVKTGGQKAHLLAFDWRSSRKHGDFRMYNSPIKWACGVFDAAKPRPFTLDEMSGMTAQGREKFFQMSLKQSQDSDSSKWRALNILERLSRQYAAAFAKTSDGEKFFRSFEGGDALYARFFLESLPGCKCLAAEMFPGNN